MNPRLHLLCCGLLFAGAVVAGNEPVPAPARIDPAAFPQVVESVQAEMGAGGRYEFLSVRERSAVTTDLERMSQLLAGRGSLAELSESQRVDLINAQERINATLQKRDRDRLVCSYQAVMGSHRKVSVCETYGELMMAREADRERAREMEMPKTLCTETNPAGCGRVLGASTGRN